MAYLTDDEIHDAIDRLVRRHANTAPVRLERCTFERRTEGGIGIGIIIRHRGILNGDIYDIRNLIHDPDDDAAPLHDVLDRAFGRIVEQVCAYTDFATIGTIDRHIDPVLARLIEMEPRDGFNLVNWARILEHDDDDNVDEDCVIRTVVVPGVSERLTSIIGLSNGITWRSDLAAVEIYDAIPDTVLSALPGRDLTALIGHPYVTPGILVTHVEEHDPDEGPNYVHVTFQNRLLDEDALHKAAARASRNAAPMESSGT